MTTTMVEVAKTVMAAKSKPTTTAIVKRSEFSNTLDICESVKEIKPITFSQMKTASFQRLKDEWKDICKYDSILETSYGEICWLKGAFLIQAKRQLPHGKYAAFCKSLETGVAPSTMQNWRNIASHPCNGCVDGDGFTRGEARKLGFTKMLKRLSDKRRKAKGKTGTNNGNGKNTDPPLKIAPSIDDKSPAHSNRTPIETTDDETDKPTIEQVVAKIVAEIEEFAIASDEKRRELEKVSTPKTDAIEASIKLGLLAATKLGVNAGAIVKKLEAMAA